MSVLSQSFWVGLGGLVVATPITLALAQAATMINIHVRLSPIIWVPAALITLAMALGSGLLALRSLQKTDPVHNIR
jgi:ABC-type antimicrobial peptide transport system permease subunit